MMHLLVMVVILGGRGGCQSGPGTSFGATSDSSSPEARLQVIMDQMREMMEPTILSVEEDIASRNRDKLIISLGNFLGMCFGVLRNTGEKNFIREVTLGETFQYIAQLLYGYGYWGPFALEYEVSRLQCGLDDLDQALQQFSFLVDPPINADTKRRLIFYSVLLNHAMKRSLFCLTSRRSSNVQVRKLIDLVDLYTQVQQESFK